ncbi:hypothetical protein LXA43DRAFT_1060897 [Ganoderma leucocontextum]|nr:hypothetical protein LXA43DRAFT_1060897 [Ganoderma leucocontextum]
MSLSTNAISSGCFCPCCSGMSGVHSTPRDQRSTNHPITAQDTLQEGALEGWRKELRRRLISSEDSGAEFLRKYVPSRAPCPPPGDVKRAFAKFAKWEPQKGREVDSYPYLLEGLDAVVSSFPPGKRPSFMDCHKNMQRFPFSAFSKNHHSTYPDIAVSFPGQTLDTDKSPDWFGFSAIMEAKSESKEDPFKKRGHKHCKTLVQLAVNTRNLMHAHGLTCGFVFGIYGKVIRICRFDHSGAVICRPLSLKVLADLKIVQQFFWNFVHPTEDGPFVGWDPTVRRLNDDDEKWLRARLELAKVDTKKLAFTEARSVQMYDGESEGGREPQTYIAFKVLDVNGRLFSRATTVWHGIRDTRRRIAGRLVDPPPSADDLRVRVIKEVWRQIVRRPEKDFYDRLDSAVPSQQRVGLPSLVCGGDLGEREVRLWESALYGGPVPITLDGTHHKSRLSASASQPSSTPPLSLSASSSSPDGPAHRPMQQTFTWRQARSAKYWYRERSHMRFVVREVGRPVTQFRNTKELAMAFRDAIIGHRTAMAKGGILHRDVSVGNILIVDDPALQAQFCGFIHDFDYSSMSREVPQDDILSLSAAALDKLLLADDIHGFLKERTGTFLFMAKDLIDAGSDPIIHAIRHDLEPFYWALLWVVLRHTKHRLKNRKDQSRQQTCAKVFKQGDADDASMAKVYWLVVNVQHLTIFRNSPLTDLMREFGSLVAGLVKNSGKSLDYDNVLALFDNALAGSWPEVDDGPLDYIPPDLRTVNEFSSFEARSSDHHHRHGRKRAQTREGKEHETTEEQSDDDDDYDEPWESDAGEDEPGRAIEVDFAECDDNFQYSDPLAAPAFDQEDWQEAADVSAMLGYDIDMEDSDVDANANADTLLPRLDSLTLSSAPSTAEADPSGVAGFSDDFRSRPPPLQRRVQAAAGDDTEPRKRPPTRAQTRQANAANPSGLGGRGGMSRSGPQTRSTTRTGNSGATRSEGGSQAGSRGSRRAR